MLGSILFRFISTIVLLVIEVFLTMLVYAFLNLRFTDTFGWLAGLSGNVGDGMRRLLLTLIPSWANSFNATLGGELSPKAVLLLLIGLVVAVVVRGIAELVGLSGRRA